MVNTASRAIIGRRRLESVWCISYIESISQLRTSTYYAQVQVQSLERTNKRLMQQIAVLEAELDKADTGPANLPIFRIG